MKKHRFVATFAGIRFAGIRFSGIRFSGILSAIVLFGFMIVNSHAAQMIPVAEDIYFRHDPKGTNSVIWVTEEGVMVIDTTRHPVWAETLLADIRKITDAPIKYAVNSQAHGDHYMGNQIFKAAGATIIAQQTTAQLIDRYFDKEIQRRKNRLKTLGLDYQEIRKVLPDMTFASQLIISMSGKTAELLYPGPGQDPGSLYVYFPHARVMATSGNFTTRGVPNPMFTPSLSQWLERLAWLQQLDVEYYLPGHSGIATRADVTEAYHFMKQWFNKVEQAHHQGLSPEQATRQLGLEAYQDWRNYQRLGKYTEVLYQHLDNDSPVYWQVAEE